MTQTITKLTGKALDKAFDSVTKDQDGRLTRSARVQQLADAPGRVAARVEQQRAFLAYVAGDERPSYRAFSRYVPSPAWDAITYVTLQQRVDAKRAAR